MEFNISTEINMYRNDIYNELKKLAVMEDINKK